MATLKTHRSELSDRPDATDAEAAAEAALVVLQERLAKAGWPTNDVEAGMSRDNWLAMARAAVPSEYQSFITACQVVAAERKAAM
jgi:hypothetical protein